MNSKIKSILKNSLVLKILTPVIIFSFFILFFNNYILIKEYKVSTSQILLNKKKAVENFIKSKIKEKGNEIKTISEVLSEDKDIISIYQNDNTEKIKDLPVFKIIEKHKRIKVIFYKTPENLFFKIGFSESEKIEEKAKKTLAKIAKTGKDLYGFELDNSELYLCYIVPIIIKGKMLGFVDVSYNIRDFIINPIEKIFGAKAVFIFKGPKNRKFVKDLNHSKKISDPESSKELNKEGEYVYHKLKIKGDYAFFSIEIPPIIKGSSHYFLTLRLDYKKIKDRFKTFFLITNVTSFFLVIISIFILYVTLLKFLIFPLNKINKTLKEISLNENLKNRTLKITNNDELGRLMESFNRLITITSELFEFKETIEEDSSMEEVFKRIEYILKDKFKIKNYTIYLIKNSKDKMRIISYQKEKMWCSREILLNPALCRAKRIGKIVNSLEDFPGICPYFRGGENFYHMCIPIYFQESVGAILQIVFDKEQSKDILKNKPLLLNYIKEASPVLEAKQLMKSLQETVMRDPLTGIYNRRFLEEFEEHLTAQVVRDKVKFGILMLDIDHFKKINDKYGHDIGDFVLKEIVEVFHNTIRRLDMVFRYGGEEFLIILNNIQKKEYAIKVAEKIRANIENHEFKRMSIKLPQITISIGVSLFPDDSEDFWKAVKKADIALYRAKETGRNKVVPFEDYMAEGIEGLD